MLAPLREVVTATLHHSVVNGLVHLQVSGDVLETSTSRFFSTQSEKCNRNLPPDSETRRLSGLALVVANLARFTVRQDDGEGEDAVSRACAHGDAHD
jgi:hypothetical protein